MRDYTKLYPWQVNIIERSARGEWASLRAASTHGVRYNLSLAKHYHAAGMITMAKLHIKNARMNVHRYPGPKRSFVDSMQMVGRCFRGKDASIVILDEARSIDRGVATVGDSGFLSRACFFELPGTIQIEEGTEAVEKLLQLLGARTGKPVAVMDAMGVSMDTLSIATPVALSRKPSGKGRKAHKAFNRRLGGGW